MHQTDPESESTTTDNDSLYLYVNNDIEYGLFEDIVDSYYNSLLGGIPPEHFNDLNFISTRRGRRLAAPTPPGDPWGYYAEHQESHHMEADRTIPETSAQPHTELSTEAMDTNEGQRTRARLLEEARHLSTAAIEPSYATIDESMSATLQGSEAAISDILVTQDPRELHKSEAGEKGPTPVEMKAGPFDFEKEFQMRHGVSPEGADKPWQSYHQYTERGMYAENILAFDARILQDIISG